MSSLKRLAAQEPGVEEEECLVRESKRRPTFLNIARKVMELKHMQGLSLQLEPFLRQVVREEIQKGLSHFVYSASRPLLKCIRPSIATCWRLTFKSKLPDTLFTGSRIESEDGTPVTIAIENSNSEMIMASSPLSSVRIEIVVIDSDFYCDEQEDWTEKEFNANVVRARDGKRPLLTGDLVVTLRGGIGKFGDVIFTDNSSWIRSRKFRLGARMLPSKFTEERIQEAVSGTFFVKDHRGALCSKHHPPSLHDEVWRLEKIWKDGAFHKRLSEKGIDTVREFLKFLVMDQNYLRSILGNGMSNKVWEAITEHARECQSDKKFYSYYIAEDQVTLVFDSVFQVAGVKFDGYDYQTISSLTAARMVVLRCKLWAHKKYGLV
uniref:Elongation factor Ts, mitochondrial n=1 Tax=Anthurium amnicola TaxID=1678845 RepID=A0A1D1XDR6_9ARAE